MNRLWGCFLCVLLLLVNLAPARADLYAAAKAGDLTAVRTLLKTTPEALNVPVSRGFTPLEAAVAQGRLEVVKALLDAGAKGAMRKEVPPLLHLAVWGGSVNVAALLLDRGAAVDAIGQHQETALHLAAWKGSQPLVSLLLAHGANVNAGDMQYWTPLHYAAWAGQTDLVPLFLQKGVNSDLRSKDGWTALHLAVAEGKTAVVKALLAQKVEFAKPDTQGITPLMCALGAPNLTYTEWWARLYLQGLGFDKEDLLASKLPAYTFDARLLPPRTGIAAARQEIAKLLFDAQCAATPDFAATPGLLSAAAAAGNTDILTYLLAHNVRPNEAPANTRLPLLAAAANGQVAAADLLLKAGADVMAVEKGTTKNALHLAAESGQAAMVQRLLEAGIPIDTPDAYRKQTALWWALSKMQVPAALVLIERGAKVNTSWGNSFGDEPVAVQALRCKDTVLLDKLLAAGLDLTVHDAYGRTLLHTAVGEGNLPATQWLLAHGANVNEETKAGMTPLFFAQTPEIADVLLAKGATFTNAKRTCSLAQQVNTLAMLRWCTAHGVNLDEPNADGVTALFALAGTEYLLRPKTDTTDMIAYLLQQGANPNARTKSGMTPLANAAQRGIPDAVGLLLDKGADPNIADNTGATPLLNAVTSAKGSEKAKLLLARGAKPDVTNAKGETPLYIAVQKDNAELATLLLEKQASQTLATKDGDTPLLLAMRAGKMPFVNLLLAAKPNLKGMKGLDGATPVSCAVSTSNLDLLTKLLALGAEVNGTYKDSHGQQTTPLHTAAELWDGTMITEKEQSTGPSVPWVSADTPGLAKPTTKPDPTKAVGKQMVELLLKQGADINAVNSYQETPLFNAVHLRNEATATLLIEHGADLQIKSRRADTPTIMHAAIMSNSLALVKLLQRKGLVLDDSCFFSARHGEMMDYLVAQKLSPNVKSARGSTPLHNAVWASSASTMEQLLVHGADPKAVDQNGRTTLQYMQEMQHDGSLIQDYARKYQLLYVAQGDYTVKGADGWTLLHAAAESNQHYVIDQLLANGIDINVATEPFGLTPLFAAVNARDLDAVAYLLSKKGCNVNARVQTGQTPLHAAIAVVRPPSSNKQLPMIDFMAKEKNSVASITSLVNLLLAHGADPGAADQQGKLPVDYLDVRNTDFWPLTIALAKAGKKITYRTPSGLTLLHMAVAVGDAETTQQLLTAKADLNAVDARGRTPLHIAVICRQYALAQRLIAAGCNVTLADIEGMTALHMLIDNTIHNEQLPKAAVWGLAVPETLQAIDTLLAHGADINARNHAGKSVLALSPSFPELKAIRDKLLARGARE